MAGKVYNQLADEHLMLQREIESVDLETNVLRALSGNEKSLDVVVDDEKIAGICRRQAQKANELAEKTEAFSAFLLLNFAIIVLRQRKHR